MSAANHILKNPEGLNPCCNGIYSMSNQSYREHWDEQEVLILVVMEYTQWVISQLRDDEAASFVLILVVMEYTQWVVNLLKVWPWRMCLNPCCNGIYSMSSGNHLTRLVIIVLILVVMEYTQWGFVYLYSSFWWLCLNPCCNGIYSMSPIEELSDGLCKVLILVVMEYTQWVRVLQ